MKKTFKSLVAVNDVSFKVNAGEYLALLGPNGAGKTTLIEMIEGIQKQDKGEILIQGKSWNGNEEELHRIMGISLQETHFVDRNSVEETLNLFSSFYGLPKSRAQEILEIVGLEAKRKTYVNHLSGGQRQKLALGVALLNNPKVLLLDEPTTGLDPNARREIWNLLEKLKRTSGTAMILTTHYMEEAQYLCDRIIIMNKGSFLAEGTLPQLIKSYGEGEVIQFLVNKPFGESLKLLPSVKKVFWEKRGTKGKLVVSDITITLPHFLALIAKENLKLLELESRKVTLEDLFISLTGKALNE
ncbi:ABC transporter ATP-binding protein [Sporocytophaga myxococcoides]|uniref:ABC transporter ATP-binding protein n=1 Tax=Sporocytophaga myxococcoides TaxID=153721 RepID=UPI0018CCE86C|nr:ABC transporter ATP-binding protein [Sporocytophaga myxococcoides]